MREYVYRSGEVHGAAPPGPSPLPPDTSTPGQRLARRARLARKDPDWRQKTKEQKDLAIRVAALDEQNDRRRP